MEPQHPSLFAALPIPPELADQIMALPRGGLDKGKFLHRDDLHITLRYIGRYMHDRDDISIDNIQEALSRVRRPDFNIVARGMATFALKNQTILYAAIESTRKLTALTAEINEKLAPLGFEMPNKPFVPHVTIARLPKSQNPQSYMQRHAKSLHTEWKASQFHFYSSADEQNGEKRYKILETYALG
jgi:2'-5' RNA ligase